MLSDGDTGGWNPWAWLSPATASCINAMQHPMVIVPALISLLLARRT
jgi:hypothetical protein